MQRFVISTFALLAALPTFASYSHCLDRDHVVHEGNHPNGSDRCERSRVAYMTFDQAQRICHATDEVATAVRYARWAGSPEGFHGRFLTRRPTAQENARHFFEEIISRDERGNPLEVVYYSNDTYASVCGVDESNLHNVPETPCRTYWTASRGENWGDRVGSAYAFNMITGTIREEPVTERFAVRCFPRSARAR